MRDLDEPAVVVGDIISRIYSVVPEPKATLKAHRDALESRLDQWLIDLDESLRFDGNSQRMPPPPNILHLNIQYWAAVALLHRAL